jgi:SAM-dependent methyltransferase
VENYRYWQENGSGWLKEYNRRKSLILLATVASRLAPGKVLEYGCGVGRHLSYLHRIPGIIVRGFDQSPTMVAEIEQWAPPGFVAEHVVVGEPVSKLPFADGEFDLVFTSEVLVHVRPEDVPAILRELIRVSKKLVVHIEPGPATTLLSDVHNGCWGHDLVGQYLSLSETPKVMPRLFQSQDLIAVERVPNVLSVDQVWPDEIVSELLRNMERNLSSTIDSAVSDGALNTRLADAESKLAACENELAGARNYRAYVAKYGYKLPDQNRESSGSLHERFLKRRAKNDALRLEVIGANPRSGGNEIWLRHACREAGDPAIPWSTLAVNDGWCMRDAAGCTDDKAILGTSGEIELPDSDAPILNFMRHAWSGCVRISWRGKEGTLDLFNPNTDDVTIDLAQFFGEEELKRA